jgi:hypothetical protein
MSRSLSSILKDRETYEISRACERAREKWVYVCTYIFSLPFPSDVNTTKKIKSREYSPFVKFFETSAFPPSESELKVEFSMELLFCVSGARFSLIDSCDEEFSVYLWRKKMGGLMQA